MYRSNKFEQMFVGLDVAPAELVCELGDRLGTVKCTRCRTVNHSCIVSLNKEC
jgi:hypothetical protein